MKEIHPLKRKSVKPSSSTVRGMLPVRQFRALDAAMQSLRAAGLRFDWQWQDKNTGWICAGLYEDATLCELIPSQTPLIGQIRLAANHWKLALAHQEIPETFKSILKAPIEKDRSFYLYEFELESTPQRDLFSNFIEALQILFVP